MSRLSFGYGDAWVIEAFGIEGEWGRRAEASYKAVAGVGGWELCGAKRNNIKLVIIIRLDI